MTTTPGFIGRMDPLVFASRNQDDALEVSRFEMRRILDQAANATVKTNGRIFELVYRRLVPRLGHAQAVGAIAHHLCRLIWKIIHDAVVYEERGPAVTHKRQQARTCKMIRELRSLGYRVEPARSVLH